ncbi:MAG: class I SAM-dependent methyltransferase [Minisyncoccia bacterium]
MSPIRLNLACGGVVLGGWQNLDYESRVPGVIHADLLKGIPYPDAVVDEILASHFLEHLKLRTEAVPFLQECERVLKPGGVLSLITPDFAMLNRVRWFDYHFNRFRNRREQRRWLVGATFGEGRTAWDYHVSGWYRERYEDLGRGSISVDPAAGPPIPVWTEMELVRTSTLWRSHSPYEITAIYRKRGADFHEPSWTTEMAVIGHGPLLRPFGYTRRRLPLMVRTWIRSRLGRKVLP